MYLTTHLHVFRPFFSPFPCLVISGLFSVPVSLDFFRAFLYDQSIFTHSLDPQFIILGEFQAWDWLWYTLTCGPRVEIDFEKGEHEF